MVRKLRNSTEYTCLIVLLNVEKLFERRNFDQILLISLFHFEIEALGFREGLDKRASIFKFLHQSIIASITVALERNKSKTENLSKSCRFAIVV